MTAEFSNHDERILCLSLESTCITNPSMTFLLFHRESFSPLYSGFEAFNFLDRFFSLLPYPTLLDTREVSRFSACMG